MIDLRSSFENERQGADLVLEESGLLAEDRTLMTAVIICLFTNRRAKPDDELPYADANRRGWWADKLALKEGEQIGSRLWLLWREKALTINLVRAKEYAVEALQPLLDYGLAKAVEVETEQTRPGVLGLRAVITKPNGEAEDYRFEATAGAFS